MTQKTSTYFLPLKRTRTFLFIFGFTDGWWGKYLSGFTHVALMEFIEEEQFVIGIEPLLSGSRTIFRTSPIPQDFPGWTVLKVCVQSTRKNRLIRPIFQTCATIVQYHAGLSLGCIKASTLYNRMLTRDKAWLRAKGIRSVEEWVQL